jgi:hypothetical protein
LAKRITKTSYEIMTQSQEYKKFQLLKSALTSSNEAKCAANSLKENQVRH